MFMKQYRSMNTEYNISLSWWITPIYHDFTSGFVYSIEKLFWQQTFTMVYEEKWKHTKWIDLSMTMMLKLLSIFSQLYFADCTWEKKNISSFKSALGTAWKWEANVVLKW